MAPPEWATPRLLAIAGVLLLLLGGVAALLERIAPPPEQGPLMPALSVHSSRDSGARALYLWLAEMGYRTDSIERRLFGIDPPVRALFVLAPARDLSELHVSEIVAWVERGGTLVVAAERPNRLLERLGVQVERGDSRLAEAVPLQPLLRNPPVERVEVGTPAGLRLERPEWVPLLGAPEPGGRVVAAVAAVGRGRAFALAAQRPLSNDGIGEADAGALVLHLLDGLPAGSALAFDEYHHGLTEHGTLGTLLLTQPWGWALLYAAALTFAYVAARGRRFGRAVPATPPGPRRSRAEYVATVAGLLRHGGHRDWLRRQFAAQVRREVATRFQVRADLPAREFAAALAARRPEAESLAAPLARLEDDAPAGEATTITLMREVDRLRARLLR